MNWLIRKKPCSLEDLSRVCYLKKNNEGTEGRVVKQRGDGRTKVRVVERYKVASCKTRGRVVKQRRDGGSTVGR